MEQELFAKLRAEINARIARREKDFQVLSHFVRVVAQRIRTDTGSQESCVAGCVEKSGKFSPEEYFFTDDEMEFTLQVRFPGLSHREIAFEHNVTFKIVPEGEDFMLTRLPDGEKMPIRRSDLGDLQVQRDVASMIDLPVTKAVDEILKR